MLYTYTRQEVDLRALFTFDKLRESGRVKIITTAEFLAMEAVTGGLGIQPGEKVMQLNVKVKRLPYVRLLILCVVAVDFDVCAYR